MAKPFCTCPIHGWTERTESGGPCKKCVDESTPAAKPMEQCGTDVQQLKLKIAALVMNDQDIEELWLSGLRMNLKRINCELRQLSRN